MPTGTSAFEPSAFAAVRLFRPRLVGIAGYGGTGKDTLAEYLVKLYGFRAGSFGSHIAALLADINPIVTLDEMGRPLTWNDIQQEFGYEGSKAVPEVLPLLIATGEHIKLRQPDFWVRQVLATRTPGELTVITGPRSVAELDAIRNADGALIRVNRPGVEPRHEQETQIDGYAFDLVLDNDGSPDELWAKAQVHLELERR